MKVDHDQMQTQGTLQHTLSFRVQALVGARAGLGMLVKVYVSLRVRLGGRGKAGGQFCLQDK